MAAMKRLMFFSPPPPHLLLSPIARSFSTRRRPVTPFSVNPKPPKAQRQRNAWNSRPSPSISPVPVGGNHDRNSQAAKVLQGELWKNVVKLTCDSTAKGGVCHVYLVGTSHYSQKSCQEVQAVIDFVKPQALFLGLCPSRASDLRLPQILEVPQMETLIRTCIATRNPSYVLRYWFASQLSQNLGVLPGAVFGVASRAAAKYTKTTRLGDRPYEITWARTRAKMPLWHKIKLPFVFLRVLREKNLSLGSRYQDFTTWLKAMVDVDKDKPNLMTQAMAKHLPTLMETFVFERDRYYQKGNEVGTIEVGQRGNLILLECSVRYMSANLLEMAKEHNVVVAVVGRQHLPGIQENWGRHVVVEDLLTMPSQKKTVGKILSDIAVTVAVTATISYIVIHLVF